MHFLCQRKLFFYSFSQICFINDSKLFRILVVIRGHFQNFYNLAFSIYKSFVFCVCFFFFFLHLCLSVSFLYYLENSFRKSSVRSFYFEDLSPFLYKLFCNHYYIAFFTYYYEKSTFRICNSFGNKVILGGHIFNICSARF